MAIGSLLVGASVAIFVALCAAVWLRWQKRAPPVVGPRERGVCFDGRRLCFHDGEGGPDVELADLGDPFGVTFIANRARTRIALVVSTRERTLYVGAEVARGAPLAPTFPQPFTVASDERALSAAAPDGRPLVISHEELAALHATLIALDPRSPTRLFSIDARGDALVLDAAALTIGPVRFDLSLPLGWRATLFRERGFGGVDAVYQATYVQQGELEVALVSILPTLSSPMAEGDLPTGGWHVEREVKEDVALLEHSPSLPPPRERRVAIDRIFVLPIRRAIARAPQARRAKKRVERPSLSN